MLYIFLQTVTEYTEEEPGSVNASSNDTDATTFKKSLTQSRGINILGKRNAPQNRELFVMRHLEGDRLCERGEVKRGKRWRE